MSYREAGHNPSYPVSICVHLRASLLQMTFSVIIKLLFYSMNAEKPVVIHGNGECDPSGPVKTGMVPHLLPEIPDPIP